MRLLMTGLALAFFLSVVPAPVAAQLGDDDNGPVRPIDPSAPHTTLELDQRIESTRRVEAASTIAALGEDLFGDTVSYYTGQVSFSITDVDLPGNNELPVRVTRTFSSAPPEGPTAPALMGEWELALPHLRGIYGQHTGWRDELGGTNRCSVSGPPPIASTGAGNFGAEEYWRGVTLSVPGAGDQGLLLRNPAYTQMPNDGRSYPWVTVNHWQLRCGLTLRQGAGEGFVAVSPNGLTYRFDWMTSRRSSTIQRALVANVGFPSLLRDEVRIYATRVEDRFNNWVEYTFAPGTERIQTITSSDGRSISFTYNEGTGTIATVSANGRTWTYTYSGSRRLQEVTLPDQSKWTMATPVLNFVYNQFGPPTCALPPWDPIITTRTLEMTHPSGASVVFEFSPIRHARNGVPPKLRCRLDGEIEPGVPRRFDAYALTRKTITAPSVSPMIWTVAHPPSSVDDPQKTVTLTRPDQSQVEYTFGTVFDVDEGKLREQVTRSASGAELRREAYTYVTATSGLPYARQIGSMRQNFMADEFGQAFVVPQQSRTITQQGVTFSSVVDPGGFDAFARVTSQTQSSSLGDTRAATQTYEDRLIPWVLGLPRIRAVNGAVEQDLRYDAAALLEHAYRFGERQVSLAYRPDGTIATITDGRNHVTTANHWKRGLPQQIVYHSGGGTRSAEIDDNGWVTSTTDEVSNTRAYDYDDLGRIESTTYPIGWAPTVRTFARTASVEYGIPAGSWKQTIATGNYRKHVWFDGLWRSILEREWDILDPAGTQRFVRRGYDLGFNQNFVSFAASSIASINDLAAGTTTVFDALRGSTPFPRTV